MRQKQILGGSIRNVAQPRDVFTGRRAAQIRTVTFVFDHIDAADPDVLWCKDSAGKDVPVARPRDLRSEPSHGSVTFTYDAVNQTRQATDGSKTETHQIVKKWLKGDVIDAEGESATGVKLNNMNKDDVVWLHVRTNRIWMQIE